MTKIGFWYWGCQECDRPIRPVTYEVIETSCWILTKFLSKCCASRYALTFKCFLITNVVQSCSWSCNFFLLHENVYVKRILEKSAVYPQTTTHSLFFLWILYEIDGLYHIFIFHFLYTNNVNSRWLDGCTLVDMKSMNIYICIKWWTMKQYKWMIY
jgi:hypothetical protein